jgi:high-affinity iron transporter
MILAAGMLTNSLTELHEATIISDLGSRPWDTEEMLPMSSDLGKFSHTILGYDSAPAMSQIVLYWSYITFAVVAYFALPLIIRPLQKARPRAQLDGAEAVPPTP